MSTKSFMKVEGEFLRLNKWFDPACSSQYMPHLLKASSLVVPGLHFTLVLMFKLTHCNLFHTVRSISFDLGQRYIIKYVLTYPCSRGMESICGYLTVTNNLF